MNVIILLQAITEVYMIAVDIYVINIIELHILVTPSTNLKIYKGTKHKGVEYPCD